MGGINLPHFAGGGGITMEPVKLSNTERKKPLSYNPSLQEFLYLEDIQKGKIFPPKELDDDSKKLLTLKRLEMEEPFSIEALGMSKEQQMEEIRQDTERGKDIVRAEINYLAETIEEIKKGEVI
jgi:hypothetical protein